MLQDLCIIYKQPKDKQYLQAHSRTNHLALYSYAATHMLNSMLLS